MFVCQLTKSLSHFSHSTVSGRVRGRTNGWKKVEGGEETLSFVYSLKMKTDRMYINDSKQSKLGEPELYQWFDRTGLGFAHRGQIYKWFLLSRSKITIGDAWLLSNNWRVREPLALTQESRFSIFVWQGSRETGLPKENKQIRRLLVFTHETRKCSPDVGLVNFYSLSSR